MKYKLGWNSILLVVIMAAGLTIRLYEVSYNFDGDELFSVKLASGHFSEVIIGSLQDAPHPPLYNILLFLWIKLFGPSEVSARILSILFSGAFLLTTYVLLRRFVMIWLALGLLSVFALSPFFVYYGQQARPYALIEFLAAANLLAFIRVLDGPHDRKVITIWATSCSLLLFAQYLALLLIAFEITVALTSLRSHRITVFLYGSVGTALMLPWLIAAMGGAVLGGTDPLPQISWMTPPSFSDLVWFYARTFGEGLGLQARWLLLVLIIIGIAYIRHSILARQLSASHILLFLIGFGLPIVVYAISVLGPKSIFEPRQLLGASIAFVCIVGVCMATLPRHLAAGILLVFFAWAARSLPQAFPHNTKPPWRDVAAQIDGKYGSIAVFSQEGWVRNPLNHYRESGPVLLEKAGLEKMDMYDRFLFVCRPAGSHCSDVEVEALKSRRSLLATWQWGPATSEDNRIQLYEVRSAVNKISNIALRNRRSLGKTI
jgi:mannosyltransferase